MHHECKTKQLIGELWRGRGWGEQTAGEGGGCSREESNATRGGKARQSFEGKATAAGMELRGKRKEKEIITVNSHDYESGNKVKLDR